MKAAVFLKRGPLAIVAAALLVTTANGIVDEDGDNMSDVWQQKHGFAITTTPPPYQLPGADPDGDGWTNLEESGAGTDPLSGESPLGIIRPVVLKHPDFSAVFTVRFSSQSGKQYRLYASPDLSTESWVQVDQPAMGTGEIIEYGVEPLDDEGSPFEKLFFKISVSDTDEDGDGLSNWEEWQIGSSPYLADTDGNGVGDFDQHTAGQNPSGTGGDGNDDGVPDNVLYSVVFETNHEHQSMPWGVGFTALDGDDPMHRHLTKEIVEEYSVNGSPRFNDVSDGEYKTTHTYLEGGSITAEVEPVTSTEGETFSEWKSENSVSLGEGESLEWDAPQTQVQGPTLDATLETTTTTITQGWRVKKDGETERSGTETIETTDRTELKDSVTWQDFWSQHATARPWAAWSDPLVFGPLHGIEQYRLVEGDATAAERVRGHFRRGDFMVTGPISAPRLTPWGDTGADTRLKFFRWRWVRFDPMNPFDYTYEAPPAAYRQTFRFLVRQTDHLVSPTEYWQTLVDETRVKGIIELECEGGLTGWQEVPLPVFNAYRLTEPAQQALYDFDKLGFSQVGFGNLPAKLAVDSDRDGELTFDGRDRTTAGIPFRFWINNDQDDVESDEPALVTLPDHSARDTILTMRDMEDFCRLKLHAGANIGDLKSGEMRIGLRFRNVAAGAPAIRVWPNQSADGDAEYLSSQAAAQAQMLEQVFESESGIVRIPTSYWQDRTEPTAHLIFEGVSKGRGELAVTLHDRNGVKIAEIGGLWLHLLDVREMYLRARIVSEAEDIPHPWDDPNPAAQVWEWDPWDWPHVEDPAADNVTAIFVHGWRLTYATYMNWADTSYKRLWQQGFRGKFYTFRWPTFSGDNNGLPDNVDDDLEENPYLPPPGVLSYNRSEYRAWLCGSNLAHFVNQLPDPPLRRRLFAHSMGNVISGAALRFGMEVQLYSMCNAAMSAMAYDPNPALRNVDNIVLAGASHITVDTDPEPATRTAYGLENKFNLTSMPDVFNFGLPDDKALGLWSYNNRILKPSVGETLAHYSYRTFPSGGLYKLNCSYGMGHRQVTSLPEAMGFVTKSLTRTAGADLRTNGSIKDFQNMTDWFGEVHSAQWRWNNQQTNSFWQELFERLELEPD